MKNTLFSGAFKIALFLFLIFAYCKTSLGITAHIYPNSRIPSGYNLGIGTPGKVGGGGFEMAGGTFFDNGWSVNME